MLRNTALTVQWKTTKKTSTISIDETSKLKKSLITGASINRNKIYLFSFGCRCSAINLFSRCLDRSAKAQMVVNLNVLFCCEINGWNYYDKMITSDFYCSIFWGETLTILLRKRFGKFVKSGRSFPRPLTCAVASLLLRFTDFIRVVRASTTTQTISSKSN